MNLAEPAILNWLVEYSLGSEKNIQSCWAYKYGHASLN